MNSNKLNEIKLVRVEIKDNWEEYNCVADFQDRDALLRVEKDIVIGVYKMISGRLFIVSSNGEYEIKDWNNYNRVSLDAAYNVCEYGEKLRSVPLHSEDFIGIIEAFKCLKKEQFYEDTSNILSNLIKDRVVKKYGGFDESKQEVLNEICCDLVAESYDAIIDKNSEDMLNYFNIQLDAMDYILDELVSKQVKDEKPNIITKVMSVFK